MEGIALTSPDLVYSPEIKSEDTILYTFSEERPWPTVLYVILEDTNCASFIQFTFPRTLVLVLTLFARCYTT